MDNVVAGDTPVSITTRNFNLTVKKTLLEGLGTTDISDGATSFKLPTIDDMGLSYDKNGTAKYSAVDVAVSFFEHSASKLFKGALSWKFPYSNAGG